MDRVEPYATLPPSKLRDGDLVMQACHDPSTLAAITQLTAKTVEQTAVMQAILARLNAGIKTQSGTIAVNL